MRLAVFAFSRQGCRTARSILEHFQGDDCRAYTMERFGEAGFEPIQPSRDFYGSVFRAADALVFVGSAGIAVRKIAPYVRDKASDPAVVSVDELGRFAIPLLSGHIGGANELAQRIAAAIGATPVITTATDINHRFSVDSWAAKQGYRLSSLRNAKAVSAEILERDVPLCCEFPIVSALPNGVVPGGSGPVGIRISYTTDEPFERTLRLIPPVLHLGIGCRRGVAKEEIDQAVDTVLAQHAIDLRAINCVASVDLKAQEATMLLRHNL